MKRTSPVSRSGRFAGGPAAAVAQFTESISFDRRLWRQDIAGSMAHATMLREAGFPEHRRMGHRSRDVLPPEPPVEGDGFGELRDGSRRAAGKPSAPGDR